jgi:hypothetical protein
VAGFIVFLLLCLGLGGAILWRYIQRQRTESVRDRARLTVVEGQLATFRALLRLDVAEHQARQQMIRRSNERW